ncbi:EAL and HDOD domain-containing protein [Desulfopila aestuarii]|uniref:EAL and modified HD-GYP domain-containing signal transduction protein n=1 Tax=Desulfopila aestuarii DSM 18488 TaxID=1121416 RepID=A0A1M7YHZ1_9BACT|nr:HDOD domain-containing protein [Desulfopila aestuarii]SHO52128.1 EAL and modified HD-GYP domain-containing signal transduction protein [Desulfopila aestuarii DSM 18488]
MKNYESYFVAKQPILDRNLATYGYELLFRSALEDDRAIIDDPDMATISVVTSGFIKSQEELTQNKRVFINFTEKLLLDGAPRALPPAVTVIEILETTQFSERLFDKLLQYKQEGYLLAVDDYSLKATPYAFLDIADIVKIDILNHDKVEITDIVESLKNRKALKLAEKVDDGATFRSLQSLGFDLFQGYFFARPENLEGRKIGSSHAVRIRVLAVLQQDQLETGQIVEAITSDPGIAYRLLRLLNSAAFGFSMKIESIQHAVVLLGNVRIRHWLQMIILSDIASKQHPQELLHLALSRGKILEELSLEGLIAKPSGDKLFLFGLLSLLDIMLDMPFPEIFHDLPLSADFQAGYLVPDSVMGRYLQLLYAFEKNIISEIIDSCRILDIEPRAVMEASIRAHAWAEAVLHVGL